jgi:hypothetical protein
VVEVDTEKPVEPEIEEATEPEPEWPEDGLERDA